MFLFPPASSPPRFILDDNPPKSRGIRRVHSSFRCLLIMFHWFLSPTLSGILTSHQGLKTTRINRTNGPVIQQSLGPVVHPGLCSVTAYPASGLTWWWNCWTRRATQRINLECVQHKACFNCVFGPSWNILLGARRCSETTDSATLIILSGVPSC